ncbi:MAG: hypothetical protein HYY16_00155 [Planctomycetes bacterium]|nr:hypothetical protein [Planctomycetota bacterium]
MGKGIRGGAVLAVAVLFFIAAVRCGGGSGSGTGGPPAQPGSGNYVLTVNAGNEIYPFRDGMRGLATNNWNWIWHGLMDDNGSLWNGGLPGTQMKRNAVIDAARYLKPGVVRFAGGLWANRVGWDRNGVAPVDGAWTDPATGKPYTHAYKPALIDSYASFAAALGVETMVQVNICDDNPQMWADMVRYCNVEKGYAFKYWELGNEIELVPGEQSVQENLGVSYAEGPAEYARRFAAYRAAMLSMDPSIKLVGPCAHQPYRAEDWFKPVFDEVAARGQSVDVLSWHSYPLTDWNADPSAGWPYEGGSVAALLAFNKVVGTTCIGVEQVGELCPGDSTPVNVVGLNPYRRQAAEFTMGYVKNVMRPTYPTFETAITEFGTHAFAHEHPINGNHVAAVWLADMLGRYAYNGLDMITYYDLEDGGPGPNATNSRGLLGIWNDTVLDVRPTYVTEFMYAQYFGDVMVESATDDPDAQVVVWASTDTADPGALKLMLVNLKWEVATARIDLAGFAPASGLAYLMVSQNPLAMDDPASFTEHTTTLNGVRLPDYVIGDPSVFTNAVNAIQGQPVAVGGSFTYTLPPYSAAAIVLR